MHNAPSYLTSPAFLFYICIAQRVGSKVFSFFLHNNGLTFGVMFNLHCQAISYSEILPRVKSTSLWEAKDIKSKGFSTGGENIWRVKFVSSIER